MKGNAVQGDLSIFTLVLAKCIGSDLKKEQRCAEAMLLRNRHVIWACRTPKGKVTHIFLCGFRNAAEMNLFLATDAEAIA